MRNRRQAVTAVLSACILVAGALALIWLAAFFGWQWRPPAVQAPAPSPSVQTPAPPRPAAAPQTPTAPTPILEPMPAPCGMVQASLRTPSPLEPPLGATGYGGEPLSVGRGALEGRDPTFAPDGREIALVKNIRKGSGTWTSSIWIAGVDGHNLRPLTMSMSQDPVEGSQPAWSPDGSRIAFASGASGNADIWVIGRDGSNPTRVTTDPDKQAQPAWSPDGRQIAFITTSARTGNIWIINADGSGLRRVTIINPPGGANHPSFSPDGSRIVFSQSVYAKVGAGHSYAGSHLAIVNADGTGLCQLTTGDVQDSTPGWSKSGIVFSRSCCALWLIQPDGSGLQALPATSGSEPSWSPDGTLIVFNRGEHIYVFNLLDRAAKPLTQLNAISIVIYIKPGRANVIDPKSADRIPVAILSTPWFDPVRQIDRASITFGPTGDERGPESCVANEVNQDGVPDLVCEFDVAARFTTTHTEGVLKAKDVNGFLFEGQDVVSVLPP